MKLAIFSLGGSSSLKILKEASRLFKDVSMVHIKKTDICLKTKSVELNIDGNKLKDFDCVYIRGSHKYTNIQSAIAESYLNKAYLPTLPFSFSLTHDKFLTALFLRRNNVPIPTTYLVESRNMAKKVFERVQYPIVIKIPSGTHGKGVMFADTLESAKSIMDALQVFNQPFIIQEFIESSSEEICDVRAIVCGDKVIACMKRKASKGELRANIHMGGTGENFELNLDQEQVAIRAAKCVGSEICGVDMLIGREAYVLEVNLSPGLEGISMATKKNVAKLVAEYLYNKTNEHREKESSVSNLGEKINEIVTNLNIKAGVIKLPSSVSKMANFINDDEVLIKIKKGIVKIVKSKE